MLKSVAPDVLPLSTPNRFRNPGKPMVDIPNPKRAPKIRASETACLVFADLGRIARRRRDTAGALLS
jgi:hypothetical protein